MHPFDFEIEDGLAGTARIVAATLT